MTMASVRSVCTRLRTCHHRKADDELAPAMSAARAPTASAVAHHCRPPIAGVRRGQRMMPARRTNPSIDSRPAEEMHSLIEQQRSREDHDERRGRA